MPLGIHPQWVPSNPLCCTAAHKSFTGARSPQFDHLHAALLPPACSPPPCSPCFLVMLAEAVTPCHQLVSSSPALSFCFGFHFSSFLLVFPGYRFAPFICRHPFIPTQRSLPAPSRWRISEDICNEIISRRPLTPL